MPLKKGKNTNIIILVRVAGHEPVLEQTVKGLGWLRANGTLPGNIRIVDDGMDQETEKLSVLLQGYDALILKYENEKPIDTRKSK